MEQSLLLAINRDLASPWLDRIMAAASSWDLWWPLVALAPVFFLVWGGFRGRAFVICCLLCIAVVDGLVTNSLKPLIGRPRPNAVVEELRVIDLAKIQPRLLALWQEPDIRPSETRIAPVRGSSFPSGHAANNFCIATVAWVFYRRWGWLLYLPASLVAFSRIYTGSHWPTDIVFSVFMAIGVTCCLLALFDWLWEKRLRFRFRNLGTRHPHLWGAPLPAE